MKGAWRERLGVVATVALALCGCRQAPTAKDISLSKFGGVLNLKLNVNVGDKFVYEETTENSQESLFGTFDDVEKEITELEVMDHPDGGTKLVMTDTTADADSSDGHVARIQKREMARLKDLHVEGVYDEHGAVRSITPVTTDPLNEDLVRERLEGDAGLQGIVLPPGPVHIGDQWSGTVTLYHKEDLLTALLTQSDQAPKVPVVYKLVGAQEEDGKNLAVIEWSFEWREEDPTGKLPGATTDSSKPATISTSKRHGRARVEIDTGMVYDAECDATEKTTFLKTSQKRTIRKKSGR